MIQVFRRADRHFCDAKVAEDVLIFRLRNYLGFSHWIRMTAHDVWVEASVIHVFNLLILTYLTV